MNKVIKQGNKTTKYYDSDKNSYDITTETKITNEDGSSITTAKFDTKRVTYGKITRTDVINADGTSGLIIKYDPNVAENGKIETTISYSNGREIQAISEYDPVRNKGIAKSITENYKTKYYKANNDEVDRYGNPIQNAQ